MDNLDSIIEGILFSMGEPVEITKLAYAFDFDIKRMEAYMEDFVERYNSNSKGIQIIMLDNAYQMTTKPEIFKHLIKVAKQPKKFQLTQALLETLSIVAFKQPVTKLDVEKIRGVNSDYVINRLVEYSLVEEIGRSETIGRPILFATTPDFLRIFGLKNIDELENIVSYIKLEDADKYNKDGDN